MFYYKRPSLKMDLGAIGEWGQGEEATFKKDNLALMNWAKWESKTENMEFSQTFREFLSLFRNYLYEE